MPEGLAPDELTLERASELLDQSQKAEEPLGICPDTGRPIYLKTGRFGPYVQRAAASEEEKPQNASLLKGMRPEDIDLAMAVKLLSLPRQLGTNPATSEPVVAYNGKFGPYVKCGEETRSLPAGVSPLEVTLAEALELLAQPKAARRGFGAKREPLKVLDASPITNEKDPALRRPLRTVCNRWNDERVAAQEHDAGRGHARACLAASGGTSGGRAIQEGFAS